MTLGGGGKELVYCLHSDPEITAKNQAQPMYSLSRCATLWAHLHALLMHFKLTAHYNQMQTLSPGACLHVCSTEANLLLMGAVQCSDTAALLYPPTVAKERYRLLRVPALGWQRTPGSGSGSGNLHPSPVPQSAD